MTRTTMILAAVFASATTTAAIAAAPTPAEFVKKAGASDLYERESSKLVLATTNNPKVKNFATQMITDHTTSTNKVKAAATKAGLTPKPPMLEPKQQQMIADLKKATGPARDTAYISQQKMAHPEALALHQNYAANGTSAPLKAAAAEIAPVVQHHIQMLQGM